jgi:leucyl-tRNA synthetase
VAKTKTGVFTGAYAKNPVNDAIIPIWIADYVLASYGTGAIMAVPGHDERDFEFAKQFNLPIVTVVAPNEKWLKETGSTINDLKAAYTDDGVAVNSGLLDGLSTNDAIAKIIAWLEEKKLGTRRVNYKLRDWLFSRQRYWGEPFPLLHELDSKGERTGVIRPLKNSDLPLELPELHDYKPTGTPEGPLSKAKEWINVTLDGKKYARETNTMPQWAGSCWYYLRYIDPKNDKAFADPAKLKHWLPVDLYIGGAEHAVLHLLYSRFWHKVLFDRGYLHCPEPFQRLVNQGMILGENDYYISPESFALNNNTLLEMSIHCITLDNGLSYVLKQPGIVDSKSTFVVVSLDDEQIEKRKGTTYVKGTEIEVTARADKMSKSRGNVVNPDDVIREYGADSMRLYEMFMGPLEAVKPWNMHGVEGVYRFLGRVWRLIVDDPAETMTLNSKVTNDAPSGETLRELHRTIQKVTEDTEHLHFNTAISAMMEFSNHLTKLESRPRAALETLVLLLSPYAPHICEELWRLLGHPETLAYEPWPQFDPALTKADTIEVPVQINGKLRAVVHVAAEADKDALEAAAKAEPKIAEALAGKTIKKAIVVPKKMVNFVIG